MNTLFKFGAVLRCATRPQKSKPKKKNIKTRLCSGMQADASLYFQTRMRVEDVLSREVLESFRYHMDVLEAFMCHCRPNLCDDVSNVLVLNLTVYLCSIGRDSSFPVEALPTIAPIARQMLLDKVRTSALSNEFEKIALHAAFQFSSSLSRGLTQVSEKTDKIVV